LEVESLLGLLGTSDYYLYTRHFE